MRQRLTVICAVLLCALVAMLLGWSAVDEWRFSSERIGVYINLDERGVFIDDVEPATPAERAGVEPGDRLVELQGQRFETVEELERLFEQHHRPGEPLRAMVERDGEALPIELTPGVAPDVAGLLAQLLLVAAYLGLGFLAARYRHQDPRARLLMIFVALVAIELAMPAGYTLGSVSMSAVMLYWLLATGVQFGLELHLVSLIPRRLPVLHRWPRLVGACYLIGVGSGLVLCALAINAWFLATDAADSWLANAETAVMLAWAVSVAAILAWQAWRAPATRDRSQALLVLAGLVPWAVYITTSILWSGWETLNPRTAEHIENVVLLIFPATVFLAIFRYGLFDVESLVRRGLVYGAVAGLLILGLYTLLTTALPLTEQWLGRQAGQWLVTACALLIGILFRPLRQGIERLVERGLFPRRRALRHRLVEIARSLSGLNRLEVLIQQLADDTRDALDLSWSAVIVVEEGEHPTRSAGSEGIEQRDRDRLATMLHARSAAFERLDELRTPVTINRLRRDNAQSAEDLNRLGAEVLVPLYFQRRMIGILCLGRKRNGELFRREEIELLDLFSHQIATSLENLRLFQDATYEELTGLLRREVILRQLETEAARAIRQGSALSMFMIDIDHFKAANDRHGHLFGDRILARVAATMRHRVRNIDAIGRYGGEEFLLVLPETDEDGARTLAEELRQAVAGLKFEPPGGNGMVSITVSIGIATTTGDDSDAARLAHRLLQDADSAVYRAKSGGRNRIAVQGGSGNAAEK